MTCRYGFSLAAIFTMLMLTSLETSNGQTDINGNQALVVSKQSNIMEDDGSHIEGQVKNIGTKKVNFVKVLISFYDENENFLGTEFSYTEPST